jgi:hypothetical protein
MKTQHDTRKEHLTHFLNEIETEEKPSLDLNYFIVGGAVAIAIVVCAGILLLGVTAEMLAN